MKANERTTETISISGMSCGHCVRAVEVALRNVPGVEVGAVQVGKATVTYAPANNKRGEIIKALREAGYEAPAA